MMLQIVPMMRDLIESSERFHRKGLNEYNAMIIGIPNVGKSSLINIVRAKYLKKGKAVNRLFATLKNKVHGNRLHSLFQCRNYELMMSCLFFFS